MNRPFSKPHDDTKFTFMKPKVEKESGQKIFYFTLVSFLANNNCYWPQEWLESQFLTRL